MLEEPGQEHAGNGHQPASRKKSGKQAAPRASYSAWSPDIGFVPRGQSLPLREAVRQLPRHYRFILTKPGFEPFLPELGLAEWKIVWFQLLVYTVVAAALSFPHALLFPAPAGGSGLSSPAVVQALNLGSSLGLLLLIPLLFFFAMGLLYWLARAFGGHGLFVQQAYTTLLFLTPCGVLVSVLSIIPFAGAFLSAFLGVLLFIYCVVLQCFATVAVHQMSGDKATAATVITALTLIPATLICLTLWTLLFVAL
ncbi:MAG TPA: Yip1 family protein [Ktedonobacteraceae bacterium]|jgi:hypothetical protein|nr:Yip1 family protein [Ktedonobacteraceae bacterium]